MFIHAITYMYDKHTDIVFNAGNQMIKAKNILIDNIEAAFNGCSDTLHKCSSINNAASPEKGLCVCKVLFSTKRIPSICEIALRAVKYTASPNHPWFCAITPTNACGT